MKIFYFTPYFLPHPEAAAVRSYWFVNALKEAGHSVDLLSNKEMGLKLATNKDQAIKRLLHENLVGLELFCRILFSKQDLYILSSPPFFTVMLGALACILTGKKYILDVRDLYPEVFFEMRLIKENSLLGKFSKKFVQFIYKRAFNIITVTQGLIREIQSYGVNHTHLIMNGYDADIFYPGKKEDHFEKFTLVFHGNLGKVQNIETLLAVAHELQSHSDIQIVIAGEGPKSEAIVKAHLPNVNYLGSLDYQQIPALLRKCHVGLSFRTDDKIGKEAFPVKVFEYVGTNLPVVLTPKGEAGELIENAGFGKQFENKEIPLIVNEILKIKQHYTYEDKRKDNSFSRQKSSQKLNSLLIS